LVILLSLYNMTDKSVKELWEKTFKNPYRYSTAGEESNFFL